MDSRAPRATFVLAISEIIYIYTHTYLKKRKKRKIVAILQGQKSLICIYTSCTNYINPMPIGCQSNGRSSESKRADDLKKKKEKKNVLTSRLQPSAPLSSRPRGCWAAAAVPLPVRTVWWGWWWCTEVTRSWTPPYSWCTWHDSRRRTSRR